MGFGLSGFALAIQEGEGGSLLGTGSEGLLGEG